MAPTKRAARGAEHPVEDFLLTYYRLRPAQLRRWHPGAGIRLADAAGRAGWRWYALAADGSAGLDGDAFAAARGGLVRFVTDLLRASAARPPQLACFGLHEWAMVYRQEPDAVRHRSAPLRLGATGTDAVVEAHRLRCTHHDAFRFFTAAAAPRNALAPTRADQVRDEQPGCLHATMDLYKWAYSLGPAVPGDLLLDCFELARDARVLDMRASPYDLSVLEYAPVRVETAPGRAVYVAGQRELLGRAAPLRDRLLAACGAVPSTAHSGLAPSTT